jgi:hypothetical protein
MSSILAKDVFIWTEAFNCGEILNPMLKSYLAHNEFELNVFGTTNDFNYVSIESPLLKFHNLNNGKKRVNLEKKILKKYKYGHKGTAELWKYIITNRIERYFIHLDSDTVFLDDVITELIESVKLNGYSLVGSRRPYFHRTYRKSGSDGLNLDKLQDVVATDCFIFDKRLIRLRPHWYLARKIFGRRPIKHPVVDFFDPVSFEIIAKGGSVLYIDSPNEGISSTANFSSQFMQKRISFAAVGSGLNFFKNPKVKTSPGYKSFALSSYSLYAKWLLNKDIGIAPLNAPEIVNKLEKLNHETWKLE